MMFEGVVLIRAVVLPPEADLPVGTMVRIEAASAPLRPVLSEPHALEPIPIRTLSRRL